MADLSFYQKWNEVVKAAAYVQQSGTNSYQKYNYVTERDLLDAIRPTMTTLGLIFYLANTEIIPDATHGPLITVRTTYRLLDADTGESADIVVMGQGSDTQDKGVYKALTGARKYALRQFTLVATGDDPEEDTDSLDGIVKNRDAIIVLRKLKEVGVDPQDARIADNMGTTIYAIPDTKDGKAKLRQIYRWAVAYEDGNITDVQFFEALAELA